ncbi:MAG: hypothetical protein AB7F31_06530 [Parachlamydiales bacterium]
MSKILALCLFCLVLSGAAPPSQLFCLKKCHEAYCARARKAFNESERLVFKDYTRSRFEYEQGCYYLCRARCILLRMRQIQPRGAE